MWSIRVNSIMDPSKFWKSLYFQSDVVSLVIKSFVAMCSFASVSICFYIAFSLHHCPGSGGGSGGCDRIADLRRSAAVQIVTDSPTNVSHIVFGLGGSVSTWGNRRRYSELWWKPNVTRGFVWLDEKPPKNLSWPATSPPYRISGNTSEFKYTCSYGSRSAIRMARIVKETFELGLPNVRWFVMGDDDTVFFLDNLVTVLNKYDHNQMYYIGGNSESVEQAVVHTYTMAYGGGGIAISYPLAAELVRILDGCIDRYASAYGSDSKIQGCVSEIGVPLTKELGFHQVDIQGNPYGLLAAHPIAPLVSLHHLDHVEPVIATMDKLDALKKLMSAFKADPNRMLQQSVCYDPNRNWTVSVSYGYTVQLYPSFKSAKELEMAFTTFRTWKTWSNEPFTLDTRPYSEDPCYRPLVYLLDRVYETKSGKILTTYRKYFQDWERRCDWSEYSVASSVQFFDVSNTKMKSDFWKQAPRRQCCEVVGGGIGKEEAMEVKIRGCNRFESATPP